MKLEPWQEDIMARGELFCVGGVVRDELMGVPNPEEDADYVVRGIPPEDLDEILAKHGRVAFVGKTFGVFKLRLPASAREIDIAYPRKEVSTGPGHRDFDVDWDWRLSIEEDLGRRDFTINAIARRMDDGRIVDPYHGAKDISDRVLRMVFAGAFRDDPLRILRGIRFAARFSLRIEESTYAAMRECAPLVESLSAERLQDEMTKLLTQCDGPSEGLDTMHRTGVMAYILPELDRTAGVEQNEFHTDDVFWHSLKSCDAGPRDNLVVRWSALLHDVGKVDRKQVIDDAGTPRVVFYGHETESAETAREVLRRLRYGNDVVEGCAHLIENHMFLYRREWSRSTVRRFIRRVGENHLNDMFALRRADCESRGMTDEVENLEHLRARIDVERCEARAFKIADLAIDGNDVKATLGIGEGPEVGRILEEVFEMVLDEPSLNSREGLLEVLRRRLK